MTNNPFPALCLDCKHSKPEEKSSWNNKCYNQKVIAKDPWALANNYEGEPCGVGCREERQKTSPFAPCGMKAKLWEAKQGA